MIRGQVNARREAVASLRVRGPGGSELDVDAIVDTGFTASLTLPAAVVAALGLVRQAGGGVVLADGSIRQLDYYAAEVAWDGNWRFVLVSVVGQEVLLGMRLLAGHELRIAVVPGGGVEITALPCSPPQGAEREDLGFSLCSLWFVLLALIRGEHDVRPTS
jgi:clan AA aspartic protease